MEVWVRSQNKEVFSNVKSVRFSIMKKCELKAEPNTMAEFMASADAYCIECNGNFFGEYPTQERCLEIIDEIQGILSGCLVFKDNLPEENDANKDIYGIVYKGAYFSKSNHQELSTVVYEMPKE